MQCCTSITASSFPLSTLSHVPILFSRQQHGQNSCCNTSCVHLHNTPIPRRCNGLVCNLLLPDTLISFFLLGLPNQFHSTIRMMKVVIQTHQISFQHCHGYLSHHWNVCDTINFEEGFFIHVFERCDIDYCGIGLNPFTWKAVGFCGNSRYNNFGLWQCAICAV